LKRDIRINYSVLERISLNIKKYKNAIETIRQVLSFVNSKLEAENQGEAIEALKENYSELEGNLEGCQEELNDLYTIFDGYINEMQDIIRPVSSSNMMQVDRNDIWWNMESIFRACDEVGILKINVGTGMSLPNLFQSDEEKANEQKNSRMMEDIGDDIKYCYNRLNDNKDDLKNIYDKKVVPYENKDDEYSDKAGKLYFKYTNTWERTVESVKDFGLTGINIGKGLVNLAADVLKGGYGLAKGAVVIVGAGAAMKSMMETGDAPDCLKQCITKTEGYGKTVSSVLKDPVILAEGMAQGASDTVEEKGIAYSTSYVLGGVLLTKGLSKVSSASKAGEAVDVEKNVLKVDKGIGNVNYTYNMVENPGPLAEIPGTPAANFLAGKYNANILEEDKILYRSGEAGGLTIPGQEKNGLGQWFTTDPADSVVKVRIDSAVKSQWIDPKTGVLTGSSIIDSTYAVKIPKGITIYEGPVGYQGGVYLGGENCNQFFVSEPWKIKGVEVLTETPIK